MVTQRIRYFSRCFLGPVGRSPYLMKKLMNKCIHIFLGGLPWVNLNQSIGMSKPQSPMPTKLSSLDTYVDLSWPRFTPRRLHDPLPLSLYPTASITSL